MPHDRVPATAGLLFHATALDRRADLIEAGLPARSAWAACVGTAIERARASGDLAGAGGVVIVAMPARDLPTGRRRIDTWRPGVAMARVPAWVRGFRAHGTFLFDAPLRLQADMLIDLPAERVAA
jgi:hypothetical protein